MAVFVSECSHENLLQDQRLCATEEDEIKLALSPTESFMFVYQSNHMTRLLQRYGKEMCLLDGTYKTTRYSLPLFFSVVKTNVDYQVVAAFLIERETRENIAAALTKTKEWNPNFNTLYAVVDCCAEETNALETFYPGK